MSNDFFCRAMQYSDLACVIRIQAEAYVDEILETDDVIIERFNAVPDTSWVVEGKQGVCGYLVGYLSHHGYVTPWGETFSHKLNADHLYLHDLAISTTAAGFGLGPRLVKYALEQAQRRALRGATLVSVQDSKGFWQKLGFREFLMLTPAQQQHLATYAGPAFYMTQDFV
ncbi:GNAT family N-acetyltransferase [Cellvibrio mixtus]|uniref:GNAT family N-acetyltransferase n=1 Tax=Cellvibrio mixtus TaxID=39650 RepID=UPI001F444E5E|nr:GNAT family N-acetyltransferase [Cellvibrio mixtus]